MSEREKHKDPSHDPTRIDYWVAEARKLKHAADLCWEADLSLKHDTENARRYGLDQALIDAADDAELELNWLYPNLASFAIQHLAIGILLHRDPQSIIRESARFHITNAVEQCGVVIEPEVKELITNVENAFRWSDQSPQWSVRLTAQQLQTLKRQKAHLQEISMPQKKALDSLYRQLDKLAAEEARKPRGGAADQAGHS